MGSLLHADGFVCVLLVRSQTRINALFHILLSFSAAGISGIVDLDPAVERGQDDAVQEEDAIQHIADLWLRESISSAKTHPQRDRRQQPIPIPPSHADTG